MSDGDYNTLTGIPVASQDFANVVLGPLFIGWTVQVTLAGVAASNFLNYTNTSLWRDDTRLVQVMVGVVMGLLFLQTAISYYSLYHYGTWQRRDYDTLYGQTVIDCFALTPVGFLGAIVQAYLGTRGSHLFQANRTRVIYLVVLGTSIVGGLFGSILYLVLSFVERAGHLSETFPLNFNVSSGLFQWSCAFADCLITVTLCTLLYQRLGKNEDTTTIMRRLMILAVEGAMYTAVFALVGAILAYAFGGYSVYTNTTGAFLQPLSSLYTISLLESLRGRARTRAMVLDTTARMRRPQPSFGTSPRGSALQLPLSREPSPIPIQRMSSEKLAVPESF